MGGAPPTCVAAPCCSLRREEAEERRRDREVKEVEVDADDQCEGMSLPSKTPNEQRRYPRRYIMSSNVLPEEQRGARNGLQWVAKGDVESKNGHWERAEGLYGVAIALEPWLVEAWTGRGNAKFHRDNFRGAVEDFNKALKLEPDPDKEDNLLSQFGMVALRSRAEAKKYLGDTNGASEDFRRYHKASEATRLALEKLKLISSQGADGTVEIETPIAEL
mmetsp:Transcript_57519/g.136843  ORF Transcript_57519/g.136843 Transcript_57519/m.136843 type:complete len:219 (-) Transcript_57519:54-710(-)